MTNLTETNFYTVFQDLVRRTHQLTLPAGLEDKMILDLMVELQQAWSEIIFDQLSLDNQAKFQVLLADNDPDQLLEFIHNKLPTSAELLQKAADTLMTDYIRLCQKA